MRERTFRLGNLLFIQVIFDRRAYAHSFHQTAISSRGPNPGFAGIAGLARSQNREDTLIGLPNGADPAA